MKHVLVNLRFSHEIPGSRVAVIQALRFHFKKRVTEIAQLVEATPQYVSYLTVREAAQVIPWWRRKYQAEAIAQAEAIIKSKMEALHIKSALHKKVRGCT